MMLSKHPFPPTSDSPQYILCSGWKLLFGHSVWGILSIIANSIVIADDLHYMHMAFIRVPDGLIWHKSPTSGPSRVATRARCW